MIGCTWSSSERCHIKILELQAVFLALPASSVEAHVGEDCNSIHQQARLSWVSFTAEAGGRRVLVFLRTPAVSKDPTGPGSGEQGCRPDVQRRYLAGPVKGLSLCSRARVDTIRRSRGRFAHQPPQHLLSPFFSVMP